MTRYTRTGQFSYPHMKPVARIGLMISARVACDKEVPVMTSHRSMRAGLIEKFVEGVDNC